VEDSARVRRRVSMYYSPHTHLALAKARQDEFIREARQRELARLAPKAERNRFGHLLAGLFRRHQATRPAATSV
jgi:hypothetical protein